jgi:hypothetical protein
MKTMSPNLTTVTGRPRTPRDQGSVERSNKVVKDMLYAFERDQRLNGETPNWVKAIPNVNAAINAREGEGKHCISSYEVVFNMPFHNREQVLPTVLRRCETVNQRRRLMEDSNFSDMLKSNNWQDEFMTDDEEDQTHDSYWSDTSSVSYEEGEGVGLTSKKTLNELRQELGIPIENLLKLHLPKLTKDHPTLPANLSNPRTPKKWRHTAQSDYCQPNKKDMFSLK